MSRSKIPICGVYETQYRGLSLMYNCAICKSPSEPNQSAIRKTLSTRQKSYSFRSQANKHRRDGVEYDTNDIGGTGFEIVKEVLVCKGCAIKEK